MIEISKNDALSEILQKDISRNWEIPLKYLDSIITGLRNAGLIVNFSWKRSGYVLSRHPDEISIYDIYRAFEPELALVNCACLGNECPRIDICRAKDYWFNLNLYIKSLIGFMSLEQVNERKQIEYTVSQLIIN